MQNFPLTPFLSHSPLPLPPSFFPDRDPASRISARVALDHPWLTCALGFHPTLSFAAGDSFDSEDSFSSSGGASRFGDDDDY